MPGTPTTNFGLRKPSLSDQANVPGSVGNLADDVDAALLTRLPKTTAVPAEATNTPVFQVDSFTSGAAPWHVQARSYPNTGAGAGTYNHGVWLGFNASRFAGGASASGQNGVYMGFEDNYYDDGGDATYGPEWYTGYTTPDGTTIKSAGLRPLYWRVKAGNVNSALKDVLVNIDLGAGTGGALSVLNFENHVSGLPTTIREIFIVSRSAIYNRQTAWCTANSASGGSGTLKVAPASGYAQLDIVAPGTGTAGTFGIVAFKDSGTSVWNLTATTGEFYIEDQINGPRKQMSMVPGASNTTASTVFNSSVRVNGNVGFYNTAPIAKPTVTGSRGGNAALASLLTALAGQGLVTDSSTA